MGGADFTFARCTRSNNALTGSLPPEWRQLTQLQELSAVRGPGLNASYRRRSRFCSLQHAVHPPLATAASSHALHAPLRSSCPEGDHAAGVPPRRQTTS